MNEFQRIRFLEAGRTAYTLAAGYFRGGYRISTVTSRSFVPASASRSR